MLHRTSKGVKVTESGLAFYAHAQLILQQVADSRTVVAKHASDTPVGTVTLGMPQSVSVVLALPLFLAARDELPRVALQMNDELTDNVLGQLRQGKLNLALLYDYGQLNEFARKNIIDEKMFLVWNAADQRMKAEQQIKFSALQEIPLILPGVQYSVRQHIERTATQNGYVFSNVAAEINSLNIMKSAILAKIGAGIFPQTAVKYEVSQGKMRVQEIIEPGMSRAIAICASRNTPLSKANRAVSRLIVRIVRELCEHGEWPGATPIYHHNAYLAD